MRSAGYEKVCRWVGKIWDEFPVDLLEQSFHSSGILSRDNLHLPLAVMLESGIILQDYVDDASENEFQVSFQTINKKIKAIDDDDKIIFFYLQIKYIQK